MFNMNLLNNCWGFVLNSSNCTTLVVCVLFNQNHSNSLIFKQKFP